MLLYLVAQKKRNKSPIRAKKISNFFGSNWIFFSNIFIENTHTKFYTVSKIDRAATNYKKKRWITVEINIFFIFFSYAIFYFCPKRTYSRPKYLEKLHMMVYTFFFRKELTQNKVNTHFHRLHRIACRLLTEKTHVQPCFIQMWPKVTCSSEYVPPKRFRMIIWKQQIILIGYGFYFWTGNFVRSKWKPEKNCGLATIRSIFSGKNSHFHKKNSSHCLAVDDFFSHFYFLHILPT